MGVINGFRVEVQLKEACVPLIQQLYKHQSWDHIFDTPEFDFTTLIEIKEEYRMFPWLEALTWEELFRVWFKEGYQIPDLINDYLDFIPFSDAEFFDRFPEEGVIQEHDLYYWRFTCAMKGDGDFYTFAYTILATVAEKILQCETQQEGTDWIWNLFDPDYMQNNRDSASMKRYLQEYFKEVQIPFLSAISETSSNDAPAYLRRLLENSAYTGFESWIVTKYQEQKNTKGEESKRAEQPFAQKEILTLKAWLDAIPKQTKVKFEIGKASNLQMRRSEFSFLCKIDQPFFYFHCEHLYELTLGLEDIRKIKYFSEDHAQGEMVTITGPTLTYATLTKRL